MAQPEDLFEKIDPTPSAPAPATKVPRPVQMQPAPGPTQQYTAARRWPILIGAAVVLFLGAGVIAFFLMRTPTETTNSPTNTVQQNTNSTVAPTNSVPGQTLQNIAVTPDTDADGLTDDREQELGTSLTKADTDGDGLADAEEVNVYTTDPKRPDTDGDTNLDGAEVKKGYNPKGPGLLLDFEAAKQKLQQ